MAKEAESDAFAQEVARKLAEAFLYRAWGDNGWKISNDPSGVGIFAVNSIEQEMANDPDHPFTRDIREEITDEEALEEALEPEIIHIKFIRHNDSADDRAYGQHPVMFEFTTNETGGASSINDDGEIEEGTSAAENSEPFSNAHRCFAEIVGIDKGMHTPSGSRDRMDVNSDIGSAQTTLVAPSIERIAVALNRFIAYKNLLASDDTKIEPLNIPGRGV